MTPLKSSRRRLVLNGSLAVLVLAGAGVAYATVGPANSATASTLRTANVQQGTVIASVSASGNLALAATSSLAFGAAGKITEIDVKVGQQVTSGQVLAKVDPTQANLQLTEAQQQLTVAQDNLAKAQNGPSSAQQAVNDDQLNNDETALANAQKTLSNDEALPQCTATPTPSPSSGKGGSSGSSSTGCQSAPLITQDQQSVTNAQNTLQLLRDQQAASAYVDPSTIAQDQEAVTQAQAAVNNAQTAVSATVITAPTNGTILTVAGAVGSEVSAGTSTTGASSSFSSSSGSSGSGGGGAGGGSSSSAGSSSSGSSSSSSSGTFITMADLGQLQVTANVSETDVASVQLGQSATLTLNAAPGTNYSAQVSAIAPTSTVVSNVVEYAVTLDLTQTVPASVRPGQSAAITIITGQASNAVYVPSSAITQLGGRSIVTVVGSDGKQTVTPVTTGLVGTTDTQVTSGLTAGEKVLISLASTTSTTGGRGFGGIGGGLGGVGGGLGGGARSGG
ncbi:MAG TPA: efflux RND transporter periplasmic adaptor subunit [Actinocrinis sp.]|jgi:multidrug efflux pump subunit AcrA (membrane-fusion protein)|uniref:efflux RND transporter periplasmic adaptor subunit n=1 Tax=Actinocrinis sp. TaxID=1920516 RepID=UPI002DDCDEA4|nr:efflux RND transporter periplasmic adaptor subunit [Actinocrinis sp.]HEV3171839.1 efflux RND transporter periplasmic adaptor subunit [Actinocrinis sp.]